MKRFKDYKREGFDYEEEQDDEPIVFEIRLPNEFRNHDYNEGDLGVETIVENNNRSWTTSVCKLFNYPPNISFGIDMISYDETIEHEIMQGRKVRITIETID